MHSIQSLMIKSLLGAFPLTILMCLTANPVWGQTEKDTLAHFRHELGIFIFLQSLVVRALAAAPRRAAGAVGRRRWAAARPRRWCECAGVSALV